jgi:hypothetical protein
LIQLKVLPTHFPYTTLRFQDVWNEERREFESVLLPYVQSGPDEHMRRVFSPTVKAIWSAHWPVRDLALTLREVQEADDPSAEATRLGEEFAEPEVRRMRPTRSTYEEVGRHAGEEALAKAKTAWGL